MNLYRHYLTIANLTRAPHKWFLGLVCYPFHLGAAHYTKVYHLRYRHAKKLFLFDLTLLLAMLLLLFGSALWFFYIPQVETALLSSVTLSTDKVRSGETLTLTFLYENISDEMISLAVATVSLPEGFIPDVGVGVGVVVRELTIPIGSIPPGGRGTASISGRFLHTPGAHTRFVSQIEYEQTGTSRLSSATLIVTARGSILETTIEIPEIVVNGTESPITITLTNTGDEALPPIILPHTLGDGDLFLPDVTDYTVPALPPRDVETIYGTFVIRTAPSVRQTSLTLTPSFQIENTLIPQATASIAVSVVHPQIDVRGGETNTLSRVSAGDIVPVHIRVINTGDTPLTNTILRLPLSPEIFDLGALQATYTITSNELLIPISPELSPGEQREVTVDLPIRDRLTGDLREFDITAIVQGTIDEEKNLTTESQVVFGALTLDIPLRVEARAFYYTAEGDQLGRGPLPPRALEETRYWVSVTADTGSDALSSLDISITLAPGVTWTGKSSVSRGSAPFYDPNSHTLTYHTTQVGSDSFTGIFFELAITPTVNDLGKHLPLVTSIRAHGDRTIADLPPIKETIGMITTAIASDRRASELDTRVAE